MYFTEFSGLCAWLMLIAANSFVDFVLPKLLPVLILSLSYCNPNPNQPSTFYSQ